MKFFHKQSIPSKAAVVLTIVFILFVIELIIIRTKFRELELTHYQGNYARKAQLTCQEIYLNTVLLSQDTKKAGEQIISLIDQHDYQLDVMQHGGRIEGTDIFIHELPRLSAVSFKELSKHWRFFRSMSLQALDEGRSPKLISGRWISISSWYNRLIEDLDVHVESLRSSITGWTITFITLDLMFLLAVYLGFIKDIISRLKLLRSNTDNYAHTHLKGSDEIGQVAVSINRVIEELKDATDFIQSIGEGNLSMDYKELDPEYTPGKNRLADSLIDMQGKLKEISNEEKKRTWANEGISKFVEILRSSGDNINTLGDRIISTLVQYTKSNQGGLYLLNDEDESNQHLDLIALFAFDTRKHSNQTIKLGEGLLGQTFLERKTTYLSQIPKEYISITSGLGGAKPKSLLIIPLKIDEVVYGLVEIASFNEFHPYEIEFMERLGETIASTLANVKAAQKNRKLLDESRASQEMMRSQEEEMRQNMEELTATQEEIARKEKEYITRIEELEHQARGKDNKDVEVLRQKLEEVTVESENKIRELQVKLEQMPKQVDDWAVAVEVEKTLRMNLEALRIAQEGQQKPMKS